MMDDAVERGDHAGRWTVHRIFRFSSWRRNRKPPDIRPHGPARALSTGTDFEDALRQELHAALDEVMNEWSGTGENRDVLKSGLRSTLDRVVDDHILSDAMGSKLRNELRGVGRAIQAVPVSVEAAVDRFQSVLAKRLGEAGGGVERGASAAFDLLPDLMPFLTVMFKDFVNDEARVRMLEEHIETVLSRHIDPKHARLIVATALAMARKQLGEK